MVIKGADTTRRQNTQSWLKMVDDSSLFSSQGCRLDESQLRNVPGALYNAAVLQSLVPTSNEEEQTLSSSLTFLNMAVSFSWWPVKGNQVLSSKSSSSWMHWNPSTCNLSSQVYTTVCDHSHNSPCQSQAKHGCQFASLEYVLLVVAGRFKRCLWCLYRWCSLLTFQLHPFSLQLTHILVNFTGYIRHMTCNENVGFLYNVRKPFIHIQHKCWPITGHDPDSLKTAASLSSLRFWFLGEWRKKKLGRLQMQHNKHTVLLKYQVIHWSAYLGYWNIQPLFSKSLYNFTHWRTFHHTAT